MRLSVALKKWENLAADEQAGRATAGDVAAGTTKKRGRKPEDDALLANKRSKQNSGATTDCVLV